MCVHIERIMIEELLVTRKGARKRDEYFLLFSEKEKKKNEKKKNGRRDDETRSLPKRALSSFFIAQKEERTNRRTNRSARRVPHPSFTTVFFVCVSCLELVSSSGKSREDKPRVSFHANIKKPRHPKKKKMKKNAPHRLSVRPLTSASPRARCTRTEPSRRRRRREISS